jgi:hypothetical protein
VAIAGFRVIAEAQPVPHDLRVVAVFRRAGCSPAPGHARWRTSSKPPPDLAEITAGQIMARESLQQKKEKEQ